MHGAHLTLRFGGTRLRADVYWPRSRASARTADSGGSEASARTGAPSLVLVVGDDLLPDDPLIRDCVVVALPGPRPMAQQLFALRWLADHARELGAQPRGLLVAGGASAAHLAHAGRDAGIQVRELRRP
jgi:hypothetical protein